MNQYRVEVTKNGITKAFVQKSELDADEYWDKLWESFTCESFSGGWLMVREPDFVQLVEVLPNIEISENKETA
jgi:hypothetical protein